MSGNTVAVLTLAHGRHAHLMAQMRALARGTRCPDLYVVAAMDDPDLRPLVLSADLSPDLSVDGAGRGGPRRVVVPVAGSPAGLPLARARNEAAAAAVQANADLLVFLDVDCLPSRRLVERYAEVAELACARTSTPDIDEAARPQLLAGAVHYLPPPAGLAGYTESELVASRAHPARPVPGPGEVAVADDPLLFWSLSFAVTAADWAKLGGFDEGYEGYGGEDTDFAMRLVSAGGRLLWVGGAVAYHQYHDVEDPPIRHLSAIVRNSNRFRARWGFFPMRGWLDGFADHGLIRLSGSPPTWTLSPAARTASRTS